MQLYRPQPHTPEYSHNIRFSFVYVIAILFTFHSLVVAFASSTYLERFVSPSTVGLLYALGSLGSVILFYYSSPILRRLGNVLTTLLFMSIAIVALGFIGTGLSPLIVTIAFVTFLMCNPLPYFHIDIFFETLNGSDEASTGTKRGITLTLMSIAAATAPLVMGLIAGPEGNLERLFFVSIVVGALYMVVIIGVFRHFFDPVYKTQKLTSYYQTLRNDRDITAVLQAQFLLQLFFSWMIIYVPLYLATTVGLSWVDIGNIIAAGLFAYVLFELPIGYIADRYIGEKEMMILGFIILIISTGLVSFMLAATVAGWMALMFLSRVGASLVEVTTESYFFKKTSGGDAGLISLFRLTRPAANVLGALLGSVTLLVLPLQYMFLVLAVVLSYGILVASRITDSK